MLPGYNTNGLAHHDPFEAVELLAEIGYRSVAITIDHGTLNPFGSGWRDDAERMRRLLERFGMRSVIETGARFLLDPRQKHEPTLLSADPAGRARRVEFLRHAIEVAGQLGSDCVSFWSGVLRDKIPREAAMARLISGLEEVIEFAAERHMLLGFEPEPGMLIDTMQSYEELLRQIDSPQFCLTLDIGHLHCQGETPITAAIRRWADRLINVHLEDMRLGVHEHLMFGEGEIDFPPILDALTAVGYSGGLHVELSRHSHEGPTAARAAFEFLAPLLHRTR